MLYLEDYLEMIEHLPAELRDRFTDIREIDLSVQNSVDRLDERCKAFFSVCKKNPDQQVEFEKIKEEYKKVTEDASDKIQVAEDCYGLVDRYLRKLDEELLKFKLELEADNRGITEVLEKHSLEMDATPSMVNLKENRHPKKMVKKTSLHKTDHHHPKLNDVLSTPDMLGSASSSSSYPLQQALGPGGNAIAQAASQAIAATQALTGRRTSSLKASFEAIHMGVQSHEFSVGRELAGAAQSAIAGTSFAPDGPPPKRKKSRSTEQVLDVVTGGAGFLDDSLMEPDLNISADLRDQDWNFDPNEPRYCICNQVSYGDMVACDNEDCPYEWFHYPCVGIEAPPKGKWYCPTCQGNLARRKGRK